MAIDGSDGIAWAKAFLFTEIVEAPIYVRLVPTDLPWALAASAITHPFVWFVFPWLGERLAIDPVLAITLSEVFAWAVEAAFFRGIARITWKRAALVSFVANGASLGLGLVVRATLGIV